MADRQQVWDVISHEHLWASKITLIEFQHVSQDTFCQFAHIKEIKDSFLKIDNRKPAAIVIIIRFVRSRIWTESTTI